MTTYIILSRLSPGAVQDPSELPKLAHEVAARLKEQCPQVKWKEGTPPWAALMWWTLWRLPA